MASQSYQSPETTPATPAPEIAPSTTLASNADRVAEVQGETPAPSGGPANLNTERPVGGDVPADIRGRIMTSLRANETSKTLIDQIEKAGKGDFSLKWSNRGSYQSGMGIWLDRQQTEAEWYGTMTHELVHLLTLVSGQAANASTMTRQAYVDAKMEDEINAQATAFVACMQTGRSEGGAGFAEFQQWISKHHPECMKSHSDKSTDQANWTQIKDYAKVWLTDKYRNEWKTSNTGENYYTYWGKYWDSIHPGGK